MNTNETTHTRTKKMFHPFADPFSEEAWLQKQADQGWVLERVSISLFHFRQCEPGQYIVRLALCDSVKERAEVEEILCNTGAIICPTKNPLPWIYAARERSLGEFEINSTAQSKARSDFLWIKRLRTIAFVEALLALCALVPGLLIAHFIPYNGHGFDYSSFLIGGATGIMLGLAIGALPTYIKIRRRIKKYQADYEIYAT